MGDVIAEAGWNLVRLLVLYVFGPLLVGSLILRFGLRLRGQFLGICIGVLGLICIFCFFKYGLLEAIQPREPDVAKW